MGELIMHDLYKSDGQVDETVAKKYIEIYKKEAKPPRSISLGKNIILPEGMKVITDYLKEFSTIQTVDIGNIGTTMTQEQMLKSWIMLFEVLVLSPVETLIMGDNAISPIISENVAKYIRKMKNLRHLVINNAGLGYRGIHNLGQTLIDAVKIDNSQKIISLELGQNRITKDGGQILIEVIETLSPTLEKIWIHENSLPDFTMTSIVDALGRCRNLKSLNLQDNHMSKETGLKLATMYHNWRGLTYLNINDNKMSTKAGIMLLKSIPKSDIPLEELHLQFCSLKNGSLKYLEQAINETPSLKNIDITENDLNLNSDQYKDLIKKLEEYGRIDCLVPLEENEFYDEEEIESEISHITEEIEPEYEEQPEQGTVAEVDESAMELAKGLELLSADTNIPDHPMDMAKPGTYEYIKMDQNDDDIPLNPSESDTSHSSDDLNLSSSEIARSKYHDSDYLSYSDMSSYSSSDSISVGLRNQQQWDRTPNRYHSKTVHKDIDNIATANACGVCDRKPKVPYMDYEFMSLDSDDYYNDMVAVPSTSTQSDDDCDNCGNYEKSVSN